MILARGLGCESGAGAVSEAMSTKKEGKVLPNIFLASLEGNIAASFA
jgi:hypothetical protein